MISKRKWNFIFTRRGQTHTHRKYTLEIFCFSLCLVDTHTHHRIKMADWEKIFPSKWKWVGEVVGERIKWKRKNVPKRKPATAIFVDDKILLCACDGLDWTRLCAISSLCQQHTQYTHMPSGVEMVVPPGGDKNQLIATSELDVSQKVRQPSGTGPHCRTRVSALRAHVVLKL